MSSNNSTKKHTKSLILITLICVFCLSLCSFFACGKTNTSTSLDPEKSYSRIEDDDSVIKNGTFKYGTYGIDIANYPQTSSNGWSRTNDNTPSSDRNSAVNSGIVDTANWKTIISTLYEDVDFKNYITNKLNLDLEQIKADNNFSDSALKEHVINQVITAGNIFENPGKYNNDVEDSMVYMLNNYRSSNGYQLGTAQKISSNTSVKLEKNKIGVVSVWVKTTGIFGSGDKVGANIRLVNTLKGVNQNPVVIYGIQTASWQEYKLYIQGDSNYDSTFKIELGLGLGNGQDCSNHTEGTAYFDGITYTTIDAIPAGLNVNVMNYSTTSNDKIEIDGSKTKEFAYSMNLADAFLAHTSSSYLNDLADVNYTVTNYINQTITNPLFNVNAQEYAYLSFKLNNGLNRLGDKEIKIFVNDLKDGDANGIETIVTKAVTNTDTENSTLVGILVKNNFKDASNRKFSLTITAGKENFGNDLSLTANGTIDLTEMFIATGSTSQFLDDGVTETDNYNYYQLFSSTAKSTVSLHAGENEYAEPAVDTYHLSVAPDSTGEIPYGVTNVKGYTGVDSTHAYIKEGSQNYLVNTNTNSGLINTKYLANYDSTIATKLNYNGEKSIQPIIIDNNATGTSYGFISDKQTINASSYAKLSFKVRVTDDAVANIYLVDLGSNKKDVISIDFTENTTGYSIIDNGTQRSEKLQFTNITKEDMNADGWLTVTFYIATGVNSKNFRIELWNGSRDNAQAGKGYVFFAFDKFEDDEQFSPITLSSAFNEVDWTSVYTSSSSVLYGTTSDKIESQYLYQRPLDAVEIKFNKEQTDAEKKVSYDANYAWIKTNDTVYAVFNAVEPVIVDPYENATEDSETQGSGCSAQANPGTFWLGFSSILLAAVIVLALIMLVLKNVRNRRKSNKSDAKSHYVVTSRYSKKKEQKEKPVVNSEDNFEEDYEENYEEEQEEIIEDQPVEEDTDTSEQTLDEYVYGEVQDFGELETNQESESTEEIATEQELEQPVEDSTSQNEEENNE